MNHKRLLLSAVLASAFAVPAFAAGSNTKSSQDNPSANHQSGQTQNPNAAQIATKLRQSLGHAGFSDVHVMPQSFLVRAKDQDGNPVMMVVNPDSVTSVTALGATGGSGNNASSSHMNGSGSSKAGSSNGTKTTTE